MKTHFSFTPFPQIYFGEGEFLNLPKRLQYSFKSALVLTGGSSLQKSRMGKRFCNELEKFGIEFHCEKIVSEPSPEMIDGIVGDNRHHDIDLVIAIGGGSVLDAGKAVSAMILLEDSIVNYLEGVGTKEHPGTKLPFAAIPTTAGTGSEATKNAVITSIGEKGFKKSLRHDNFIPDFAVIDPSLMLSCPEPLTAACGLDAITQLLESYVSSNAGPITDALAFDALEKVIPAFPCAVKEGDENIEARAAMAYGALISGITLANAGLGIVHGFASPIGGFFDIPHGVVCGTLLPVATEVNIKKLRTSNEEEHRSRLQKHIKVARLFEGSSGLSDNEALDLMVKQFYEWVESFNIPRLSHYGIKEEDFPRIIKASGLKNNPVQLSQEDMLQILLKRL